MIRVGILGFGFMGKMHFNCYKENEDALVVAICDSDKQKIESGEGTAGNINGAEGTVDLSGIELYTDFDKMLKEAKLDAVSITLPTFLHKEFTIKALEAGVNVLCEKPIAMDVSECEAMIAAAKNSGRILQIGHCVRFWPEYARTKQLVASGQYGKVLAASFRRLSAPPVWSWNGWLLKESSSGGAIFDLHIHDSDFIQYLFGMPNAVRTYAVKGPYSDFDHVSTSYIYNDTKVVTAEGGWIMTPSFGFEMSFYVVLEKAAIVFDCTRKPVFKVCTLENDTFEPDVESGDGYSLEIAHFLRKIKGQNVPEIITPEESLASVKLVLAEKQSAQSGKEIVIE